MTCYALNLCSIPILDIEIESNAKRGRKKDISNTLTRQEYINYNEQLFPNKKPSCSTMSAPIMSPGLATSEEETTTTEKLIIKRKRKSPRFN